MARRWLTAVGLVLLASASGAVAAPQEAFDAFQHNDYATVLRVCEAPAKAGDSICQDMLGVLYSEGRGVARDQAAAFHWFQLAAAQGNPTAEFNLALAYERGEGIAKNPAEAEKWYAKAAERGLPYAQLRLAAIAVTRSDWKAAVKWLRPAAAQGLPPAQTMLGTAYELGEGVRRNAKLAAKWYVAAADHGDTTAQSSLAGLYEHGTGVDQDYKEAYFWYAVALRDPKNRNAKHDADGLKRVAAKLSASDVADAASIAKDWKPEEVVIGPKPKTRRTASASRGGPLFDSTGRVIGVVVATLDTVRLARVIGVVPENVNFAIKSDEAEQFLTAHGVKVATADSGKELSTSTIAEQAVKMTVRLECWK